jgi:hypothetical protein
MNAVLMDTRRHKTMRLDYPTMSIVVCVDPIPGTWWTKKPVPPRFIKEDDAYICYDVLAEAVFHHQGDSLRGDPVYYQVAGPELPDAWWRS